MVSGPRVLIAPVGRALFIGQQRLQCQYIKPFFNGKCPDGAAGSSVELLHLRRLGALPAARAAKTELRRRAMRRSRQRAVCSGHVAMSCRTSISCTSEVLESS